MNRAERQKAHFEKQHDYFKNHCVLPTPEKLEEVFFMVGCQDEYETRLTEIYFETVKGD